MMGQNQTNLRAKINVFLTGSQFDYIIVIINLSSLNQYISQLICKLPFTFSHLVCMSMTNYKAYIYIYISIYIEMFPSNYSKQWSLNILGWANYMKAPKIHLKKVSE